MSRDPKDGRSWDPISLHKYLYAEGNPINLVDPSGRESILEVGSLDELMGTTPVPALVETVGNFVQLQVIPFTLDAAEVTTEFVKDAYEVIESNGLMKWYVCMELGEIYAEVTDDLAESEAPDQLKEQDQKVISDAAEKACGIFVFHEPAN